MSVPGPSSPLALLAHPYDDLRPVRGGRDALKSAALEPGGAVVWTPRTGQGTPELELLRRRPGGLALIVVLPDPEDFSRMSALLPSIRSLRPAAVLPYHPEPNAPELAEVLRRPPHDLPAEVTEYLVWRGLDIDRDTRHLIRRIVELASELRSVSALARSLYMSRRALGRRFMSLGLPVPSHWLQVSRLLHVTLRLQNTDASVFSVAYEFGYPDGFSVSNQMSRLVGQRPTRVRERWGWEWLFEAWLRREAEQGALSPSRAVRVGQEGPERRAPRQRRHAVRRRHHWQGA